MEHNQKNACIAELHPWNQHNIVNRLQFLKGNEVSTRFLSSLNIQFLCLFSNFWSNTYFSQTVSVSFGHSRPLHKRESLTRALLATHPGKQTSSFPSPLPPGKIIEFIFQVVQTATVMWETWLTVVPLPTKVKSYHHDVKYTKKVQPSYTPCPKWELATALSWEFLS